MDSLSYGSKAIDMLNTKKSVLVGGIILVAALASIAAGFIAVKQLAIMLLMLFIAAMLLWMGTWAEKNILLFLMVANALFLYKFDSLERLSLLILPVVFAVVVVSKRTLTPQKRRNLKLLAPYFLFFLIVAYWYSTSGLLPTLIFGGRGGEGNFKLYYANFLNLLALLLPFFLKINRRDFKRAFTVAMWIYIVELIVVIVGYQLDIIHALGRMEAVRISMLARISFYVGFLVLFFGKDTFWDWTHLIVCSCLLLNLFWGGGRMEFGMLLFAYMWYCFTSRDSRSRVFAAATRRKAILAYATVLIIIWMAWTYYLPSAQAERFDELLNPFQSKDLGTVEIETGGRLAQWHYAVVDSPPLAFGRGFTKYFDISDYDTLVARQVETGAAHNLYASIFYTFGYVGLASFLLHLFILARKLWSFYKVVPYDQTAMFICGFLMIWYLVYSFFAASISGYFFLPYFLTGYILSLDNKSVPVLSRRMGYLHRRL